MYFIVTVLNYFLALVFYVHYVYRTAAKLCLHIVLHKSFFFLFGSVVRVPVWFRNYIDVKAMLVKPKLLSK